MTVSVVIPLYNKAPNIKRALDSVLAQTHRDLEVIVVDDGSTDGSADVVRRYRDARVRLINQANAGVSAARNRGVAEATSEYIAFLDADDEWLSDFLETVLSLRERFPDAAIWGTAFTIIGRDGQPRYPRFHGTPAHDQRGMLVDYFRGLPGHSRFSCSSVLVWKEALLAVGGFPVGVVCGEDRDTWIRIALRYPMAWSPVAKTMVHQDAVNQTFHYAYTGNYPFFRSVQAFSNEHGKRNAISADVKAYLAWRHTSLLKSNWLGGKGAVVREIARECRGIKGYRLKCFLWSVLSWVPYPLVVCAWKLRQRMSGRSAALPRFRSIYRA